jgi:hypothetical protein
MTSLARLSGAILISSVLLAAPAQAAALPAVVDGAAGDGTPTTDQSAAPIVETGGVLGFATQKATVGGSVNPDGLDTTCTFEWGQSTDYGYTAPCDVAPGAGTAPIAVRGDFNGVTPGLVVHYRLTAVNAAGRTVATDRTFVASDVVGGGPTNGADDGGRTGGQGGSGSDGAEHHAVLSLPAAAKVTGSHATLRVRCSSAAPCRGTLTLRAALRHGRRTRTATIGTAEVAIGAGTSATVRVPLSAAARTALRHGTLRTTVKGAGASGRVSVRR